MRDILFIIVFLPLPILCLVRPWIGMLTWVWFASTFPMDNLWGFASTLPGNMIISLATMAGLVLAKDEPKLPPFDRTNLLFGVLALVAAASIIMSRAPDHTSDKITEYISIFLYLVLLSIFLRKTERIHAFVWMIAFSISYFAVKCGATFIASAGSHRCVGPLDTMIADNNHFALACLLVIPLLNYLRLQTRYHWVGLILLVTMVLTALAVVSTYSRGGFIGLVCLFGYFWWNAGRKVSHLVFMGIGLSLVLFTASDSWLSRMQTIETAAEEDSSFKGRLYAWDLYWRAALDRPLIGVGPKSLESPAIVGYYLGEPADTVRAIAAHSIYFQLLGELGFIAFGTYLILLWVGWANGNWIARRTRGDPTLAWAGDLARMCQISIIVFAIVGAALSMAIYDMLLSILILLAALRRLVAARLAGAPGAHEEAATSPLLASRQTPSGQLAMTNGERE